MKTLFLAVWLAVEVHYLLSVVMQERFLTDTWHMPRRTHDVLHAGMLISAGCISHSSTFQTPQGAT